MLVSAMCSVVTAADTGSVSGAVFDTDGKAVAGAVVKISGPDLPLGRTIETDDNGFYRFEYLLRGDYVVEVEKGGVGRWTREAVVAVGRDTQVDVILGTAVSETLTVNAAAPVVDVRSSEVSFNFGEHALNTLPLERTYRGLFQLIPGIPDNRSSIGTAAGGTRQDNTYLIDGANITNPSFGTLGTEVNALDIAEVNLKRAGITAEFGRSGGSVTNAVSRSGTNQFAGIGRFDWLSTALVASYALPDTLLAVGVKPGTFRDQLLTSQFVPAIGFGGPVMTNHLFFYGSARYFREEKWDRVNKAGVPLPDEVRSGRELYGKLTGAPSPRQQLTASYRHRPHHVENNGLTNSDYSPSVAISSENGNGVGTAEWSGFLQSRSLNVRYLYMRDFNDDTPVTDLGLQPPFTARNPAAMGQYTDPAQANLIVGANQYSTSQHYRRHELRGTMSQSFGLGRTSHQVKGGLGYEFTEEALNRLANGWGLIANIPQGGVPALRARYFTPQPAQRGQGFAYSVFLQDEITTARRVTANVGVLLNRDEFAQRLDGSGGCPASITLRGGVAIYESKGDTCHFLRFGFGSEVQPRLGLTYQLREGQGDKAYATWGRYYNMDQKSSGRSLAPNRIFQTQTIFDLNGNVLSSGPLASTTGKLIDPDLAPVYNDEFVVGYATPLAKVYSLDIFFMSRALHNIMEDVPTRINGTAPDAGPFAAANLPCVRFASCQRANAERTYRALTINARRQLTRGLMTDVSYTWSRFEGNYDLDYSPAAAVFNTSSFIQDGPGTNVQDPNRFGPLFEDRPHVVKAFVTYAATGRLTTSAFLRTQSGTPWAARGRDWEGAVLNYLEPAGSHRNPTWTNLDLMATYRLPLGARASVALEARVLNVFNNQTLLSTDAQQFLDVNMIQTGSYFGPYVQPNPFFGLGNSFAPPRRLFLSAVTNF